METWHAIVQSHYIYSEDIKGDTFLFAAGIPMQKNLQGMFRIFVSILVTIKR